jgi:hypothetical protein
MSGAHKNFSVYGRPTSVKMPMVLRSSPMTVNQAWSVPAVRANGKPEAKPKGNIMPMRRFARIWMIDAVFIEPF